MSTPAVSIILPTFNRLNYLRLAIDSVFAQTFQDWELIVADDGSDGDTWEFLWALHDPPRIQVMHLAHTGNPSVVRNAALRVAIGEYVAFLDSDDVWLPHKLERQLAVMQAGARRWSYTAFTRIHSDGEALAEETGRSWTPYEGDIFEHLVTTAASIRTPSVLAERQLIMRLGGFDETLLSTEDYDLWMRLALHSEAAVVDEVLVQVRLHGQNYSDTSGAFAGRDHSLKKIESLAEPRWRNLVRKERAKNALKLSRSHLSVGNHSHALRSLVNSFPYSWPFAQWWWGIAKTMLRPPQHRKRSHRNRMQRFP